VEEAKVQHQVQRRRVRTFNETLGSAVPRPIPVRQIPDLNSGMEANRQFLSATLMPLVGVRKRLNSGTAPAEVTVMRNGIAKMLYHIACDLLVHTERCGASEQADFLAAVVAVTGYAIAAHTSANDVLPVAAFTDADQQAEFEGEDYPVLSVLQDALASIALNGGFRNDGFKFDSEREIGND
jgi:hypothetical protein